MTLSDMDHSPYIAVRILADRARKVRRDVARFTFPDKATADRFQEQLHVRVADNYYTSAGPEVYVIDCPSPQRKWALKVGAVED